jgi:signal transduction histidine kinase
MVSAMQRSATLAYLPLAARVLVAAVATALLSVLLVYLLMSLFVAAYPLLGGGDATPAQVSAVGRAVGTVGTPAIFFALAVRAAYIATRSGRPPSRWVGPLVGAISAACAVGIIEVAYGGVDRWEPPVYALAGIFAGGVGSFLALRAIGWERAFEQAARLAGAARDQAALPRALGLALRPLGAQSAALWTRSGNEDGRRSAGPSATPTPSAVRVPPAGPLRRAVLWSAHPGDSDTRVPAADALELAVERALADDDLFKGEDKAVPLVVSRSDLGAKRGAAFTDSGTRAVLVIPLATSSLEQLGLLAVALRSGRPPSEIAAWAFPAFRTTAGLALHNTILLDRAARTAALEERQRFQLDIHDTLAQDLTGIERALEAIDSSTLSDDVQDQVRIARHAAREGARQARDLIHGATDLDQTELPGVLQRLADACASETGAEVAFRTVGEARRLDRDAEVALLRVGQEALNNVNKHAHPRRVEMILTFAESLATLQVNDDGRGFDPAVPASEGPAGRGLGGMRSRMHGVGGSLFVGSARGKGTRLLAHLPTGSPDTGF